MAFMKIMRAGVRMLIVETIAKIRRAFFVQEKPIKVICRELRVSRKVVRKVIRSEATAFRYERGTQPLPKIGPWRERLEPLLLANEQKAPRERLTLIRIFEDLRRLGYEGSYDAVRRYAKGWRRERGVTMAQAYVPLSFAPGEAYQFDWSHEIVVLGGTTVTVKVAHVRLCHSRMRACISARDAGDGVRRARSGVRLFQGNLRSRHLRQHEDGGGDGVCRQGPALQPSLPADVQPLSHRADGVHAGVGVGKGTGREPGRAGARAFLYAAAAGEQLRGAECAADRPLRRLRQGAQASRDRRSDGLAGVRGGADAPGADCRPFRWLPRRHRRGLEDLPGSFRQQQVLGFVPRRRPAGRGPGLCRSYRHPAGRGDRRRARPLLWSRPMPLRSLALRPGAGPQARGTA